MAEKPFKNNADQLSLAKEAKKEASKEHYKCLINVEFPEEMMKVLERMVEGLIRQRVEIDEMQCSFHDAGQWPRHY